MIILKIHRNMLTGDIESVIFKIGKKGQPFIMYVATNKWYRCTFEEQTFGGADEDPDELLIKFVRHEQVMDPKPDLRRRVMRRALLAIKLSTSFTGIRHFPHFIQASSLKSPTLN